MLLRFLLCSVCFFGCYSDTKKEEPENTSSDTESTTTDTGETVDETDTETSSPTRPAAFTLTLSGAENMDLTFNTPSCISQVNSTNLRVFWRDDTNQHAFVLIAELLGGYDGPGDYTASEHNAKIKLQEEAGGQSRYYATTADSNTSIRVEHHQENELHGSAEAATLEGTNGTLNLSPASFTLWCDEVTQ